MRVVFLLAVSVMVASALAMKGTLTNWTPIYGAACAIAGYSLSATVRSSQGKARGYE